MTGSPAKRTRGLIGTALLLAALAGAGCGTAGVDDEARVAVDIVAGDAADLAERVDELAYAALDDGPVAGISVGIARDGEVVLAKGYGHADLENLVPATASTVYRIGSVTKQFTAVAILQLVEAGELALDDDLTEHLPDYPTQGHAVTIHHLLNHTSGIKSYTGLGEIWLETIRLDLTHDELLALVRDLPFDFAPGAEWKYNNSGYYLLGMVIEAVSGRTYEEYLREHVFGPAGLDSTHYCSERPVIPFRAEGYALEDGELVNDDMLSMRQPFSAGALCSSVLDLLRWQRALDEHRLISAESTELMRTPGTLDDGSALEYAYGLGVGELDGHRKIHHGGGIHGFLSTLAHYPDDGLTVTALANSESADPGRLERRIARAALGLPEPEVADLPLDEGEMHVYVGTYDLDGLTLRVFVEEGRLVARAADQPTTALRHQGEHVFIPDFDDDVRLVFEVPDAPGARAVGVVLHQGGARIPGDRVEDE